MEKYYKNTATFMNWFKNVPNKSNINLIYLIKHNAASSSSMWEAITNR